MAKDAHDREDLLRDATALPERIELELSSKLNAQNQANEHKQIVFCGFRNGDALSVYWGQDTVLQFNVRKELRRAFWQDRMVASYKGKLHWLNREEGGAVRLVRVEFSEQEHQQFVAVANAILKAIEDAMSSGEVTKIGQHPEGIDVAEKVLDQLRKVDANSIAVHPGVGRSPSRTPPTPKQ